MSQKAGSTTHSLENDDNYYQISDDDLEDCEDLNDDSLLEEVLESSNGNNITAGGRGPYERAWTTEATRALIHIRGPMQGMFTEGRQKRTALWLHCTRQLQKLGFRYSAAKVQKKWHNILITYSKNLPKKQTSGYVHWEFFEEMHKYLKDKKFDMYDFKMQSTPYTKTSMSQQQQQQQPPPPQQQQQTAVFREIKQAAALSNEIMAQYGSNNGNQHSVHANTADVHMDKSNDEFDEDSTEISELKQPKLEFSEVELPLQISHANGFEQGGNKCDNIEFPSVVNAAQEDGLWWKDYFERKLEVEREKIQCQKDLHREQIQFQKMSLVQQEKIERLKIDAINSLTATLQKLVETKNRKTQIV
ncbi:unnamed protein product [Ceratitis capitata]|uniref:(Mediterranean fruit fly) hypothetical protein n=1 Tax=Ceratitis capitata TaxID=7213 RepID=A0A811VCB8_CERCA|nr:unnamed protein product [Ceratitis capitata]